MKIRRSLLIVIFLCFSTLISLAQNEDVEKAYISPEELSSLTGKWEGSLTYLNYGTNEPYTMPVNLFIEKGKNEYQLNLTTEYPKEPQANSKGTLRISKDGRFLNKEQIKSKRVLENTDLEVITEYTGKDDNKKALIRIVYVLGADIFSMKKEVQFEGNSAWIKRNEYSYTRIK